MIGIGNPNAQIYFYIENVPPLNQYQTLNDITPVQTGDIANISALTGNHWRKIFNVMAKLAFELDDELAPTWQSLRDNSLLQKDSNYCLCFLAPNYLNMALNKLHIVLGKTYATSSGIAEKCHWLTSSFAINESKQIIISPYFDYRQLSNVKITQLVQLIRQLREFNAPYSN
ncbi:DUF6942 family protein [Thalassotalea atypica]|uniref:DUF6942 family protein n=1 Tax=Thalassotalea atypica TaxID=2054316 RepID=UPI0025734776|nr:hypothetical protein [Thalassotalea atypica]